MPVPYAARQLNPAHPDLANAAGVPARLANERYVESLARVVYYDAKGALLYGRYRYTMTFPRTRCRRWTVRRAGSGR